MPEFSVAPSRFTFIQRVASKLASVDYSKFDDVDDDDSNASEHEQKTEQMRWTDSDPNLVVRMRTCNLVDRVATARGNRDDFGTVVQPCAMQD